MTLAETRSQEIPESIHRIVERMRSGESHSFDHVMATLRTVAGAYPALTQGAARPLGFHLTAGTDGWTVTLMTGDMAHNRASGILATPTEAACDLLERLVGHILAIQARVEVPKKG
jgi:hypothetical protein